MTKKKQIQGTDGSGKPGALADDALDQVHGGFRPNPAGDGTTEHFFTVEISDGTLSKPSPDKKLTDG